MRGTGGRRPDASAPGGDRARVLLALEGSVALTFAGLRRETRLPPARLASALRGLVAAELAQLKGRPRRGGARPERLYALRH